MLLSSRLPRSVHHDGDDIRNHAARVCLRVAPPRAMVAAVLLRKPRALERTVPVRDLQPRVRLPHAVDPDVRRRRGARVKLDILAENRAASTDRRLAAINHAAMLLMMVAIAAILTVAMALQYIKDELPC